MPTMDLGIVGEGALAEFGSDPLTSPHRSVGHRVRGYMAFPKPKDVGKRDAWIVQFHDYIWPQSAAAYHEFLDGHSIAKDRKESFGGQLQAIVHLDLGSPRPTKRQRAEMPSMPELFKGAQKSIDEICHVGRVIELFRAIVAQPGLKWGPSLTKARQLYAKSHPQAPGERHQKRLWAKYGPVAHLAGAYAYLRLPSPVAPNGRNGFDDAELFGPAVGYLLAAGEVFADMLTTHVPAGHTAPILHADVIWRPPPQLVLPEIKLIPHELPPELLAIARKWRG